MNKDKFMDKILDKETPSPCMKYNFTADKAINITEFKDIMKQTKNKFYTVLNDSSIIFGKYENEIFICIKKKDNNNKSYQIGSKLTLETDEVMTLPTKYKGCINSFAYNENKLYIGKNNSSIYIFDSDKMTYISKIKIDHGIVCSLLFESNRLFVGSESYVFIFKFHGETKISDDHKTNQSNVDKQKPHKLKHDDGILISIINADESNVWLTEFNSNKIHLISSNQELNNSSSSKK